MRLQRAPHYPSLDPAAALYAVKVIHYAYPPLLFIYFAGAFCTSLWLQQKDTYARQHARRSAIFGTTLAVLITYVLDCIVLLSRSLLQSGWWPPADTVAYSISSILGWGVLHISLLESVESVWYPFWGAWTVGLISEFSLIILSFKAPQQTVFDGGELGLRYLRVALLLFLLALFCGFRKSPIESSSETEPLIVQPQPDTQYGTVIDIGDEDEEDSIKEREIREQVRRRMEDGGWFQYAKSFKIFLPHIWPHKDRTLQVHIALVAACLLFERGLNVLVPMQMGRVTDALMLGGLAHVPWAEVSWFILIRWLGSGAGIPALQRYLWVPVDQYSYRCITTTAYNHVMSLSSDFHASKDTGEIYCAVQQGRSVTGFVDMILFSVFPMVADLIVAFAYFYVTFGIYMALVVTLVSCAYVWVTSRLNQKRTEMRRNYTKSARRETQLMWQSMSSWETVTYFNRVGYEQHRYSGAVVTLQKAERDFTNTMALLSVTQNAIFTIGLLFASFLAVYQVTMGERKVGDFVALLSYWAQISGPLSFFTNMYRRIQELMLDAERLLQLMLTKPSVVTKPDASELVITRGEVAFEKVTFGYDPRRGAIKDMSFQAPGGKITALVGATGGGKSTCLKLLFRFYDVSSGSITIDGQDIRDVTLSSLREQIGVVPQDPRLFNETIVDNLRYACLEATDEDIYEACRSAAIHDKIQSLPDGYLSKVGEGGVKLSGGEKQRIAIARAILKNPKIVLLDEATSSVDIATERLIQHALTRLAAGRTMFVVAHRLTTIMHADQILVIDDGNIVEQGKHEDLLKLNGKYYQLWYGDVRLRDDSAIPITGLECNKPMKAVEQTVEIAEATGITATTTSAEEQVTKGYSTILTPLDIKVGELVTQQAEVFYPHTYPRSSISMSTLEPTYYLPTKEFISPQMPNVVFGEPKIDHLDKPSKHDSILKPEAKEFIPAAIAALHSGFAGTTTPVDPQGQLQISPVDSNNLLDENKKQQPINHDLNDSLANATGEGTLEQKHRRRRHRRRSRSSRSSSGNDRPSTATDSLIRKTVKSNGYAAVFHSARLEGTSSYTTQQLRPTVVSIANGSVLSPTNSVGALAHVQNNEASPGTLSLPSRVGLSETAPNVPSMPNRSSISRVGRSTGLRWKLQGKPLLSGNMANGNGAPNPLPPKCTATQNNPLDPRLIQLENPKGHSR